MIAFDAFSCETGSVLDPARQVTLLIQGKTPTQAKQVLSDALDEIEEKIRALHDYLFVAAQEHTEETVRSLVAAIREDLRFIELFCIHRCDHWDPQSSIDHDRVNNDYTLDLHAQLAAAADFGIDPRRVIALHRTQRLICEKLKELGINVSQN
ncbi:MAG: hypothetical protein PHX93_02845 [Candidatus Peribacteraceae bacterium]|jgi:hypothetical protein|nr:hypothetical protein [Candidatus Peribacteraceae bacterium]